MTNISIGSGITRIDWGEYMNQNIGLRNLLCKSQKFINQYQFICLPAARPLTSYFHPNIQSRHLTVKWYDPIHITQYERGAHRLVSNKWQLRYLMTNINISILIKSEMVLRVQKISTSFLLIFKMLWLTLGLEYGLPGWRTCRRWLPN